ncbi:hypothetical protein LTR36_003723 [Oleoguttula mirabilis]|uniref:Uncharacterized protein n=1 Tax=Oleoguttula mirabilis TaxID=1507867 RepID=A0AAV9JJ43_9PEZI|nr:hypothetical protein LTR36_003723 [Oleoguttula mirabilis]
MGAVPDLGPEHLATRWNPNGVEPAFENPSFDHRLSRRSSHVPAFSNSPRAVSPEHRRAYSPVSTYRNGAMSPVSTMRNGARSPVSTIRNEGILRTESPLRSEIMHPEGLVSPISARGPSPSRGVGNIALNGNAFAQQQQQAQQAAQQHQAALAALQGQAPNPSAPEPQVSKSMAGSMKDRKRLSLQTQLPPPPPVPEEEEMEEVISMSPAVRQPVAMFRQSRSSLMLSAMPGASSSQVNLSGMNLTSDPHKPYFGQSINSHDLIATGIENAFSRL